MTSRAGICLLLLCFVAVPLHADFASMARAIDAKAGVTQVWIPFLGFARAIVRVVEPKGVNDFQLATFEGAERLDPQELETILRKHVEPGFRPLVQSRSRRTGEWNSIYARPLAKQGRFELIILARDGEETTLVRVDVDADVLARELGEDPGGVVHFARH